MRHVHGVRRERIKIDARRHERAKGSLAAAHVEDELAVSGAEHHAAELAGETEPLRIGARRRLEVAAGEPAVEGHADGPLLRGVQRVPHEVHIDTGPEPVNLGNA
jgi:hypothetical protein